MPIIQKCHGLLCYKNIYYSVSWSKKTNLVQIIKGGNDIGFDSMRNIRTSVMKKTIELDFNLNLDSRESSIKDRSQILIILDKLTLTKEEHLKEYQNFYNIKNIVIDESIYDIFNLTIEEMELIINFFSIVDYYNMNEYLKKRLK